MAEPMSDERLAIIRRGAQALDEHVAKGGAINWAEGVVPELLAEVDHLRAERGSALRSVDRWREQVKNASARADRAEAALARVTDDSMIEGMARVLIGKRYTGRKFRGPDWSGNPLDVRDAKALLAEIRAVAAGEQTEGGDRG